MKSCLLFLILLTGCSAHNLVKQDMVVVAMDADNKMHWCHVEGAEWKCEGHR